jgi:hypothetical protein
MRNPKSKNRSAEISQSPKDDFNFVLNKIKNKSPFTFVRFSDGEMEIIRNNELIIKEGEIIWSKGRILHSYPRFDFKNFNPITNADLRDDLLEAAKFKSDNYIKGIPTSHNNALADRELMASLNQDSYSNLTFSDLFLNQNFIKFRYKVLPELLTFKDVYYVGNFRADPTRIVESWNHIQIPDDIFFDYQSNKKQLFNTLINVPVGSLILFSASSLSNIIAHQIFLNRSDLIILDVGTSIHDLVGLQSGIREYHLLLEKNNFKSIVKKLRYTINKSYKLKW